MAKSSALAKFTSQVKDTDKAERSLSNTLTKIIDDYCLTDQFDGFFSHHYKQAARYLAPTHTQVRKGTYRSSAAGKCMQAQCFSILEKKYRVTVPHTTVKRTAAQQRALYNGTFGHARWHLLFDALHELGTVKTLWVEDLRYYEPLQLSGTVDRVVEIPYRGKTYRAILDFKTMKSRYFQELVAPKPDHAKQQHAYDLFGYDADVWMMLYENKDTHELKIYDAPYSESIATALRAQYHAADEWFAALYTDKPQPELPLETTWCNWCEYEEVCRELNPDRGSRG